MQKKKKVLICPGVLYFGMCMPSDALYYLMWSQGYERVHYRKMAQMYDLKYRKKIKAGVIKRPPTGIQYREMEREREIELLF